MSKVSLKSIVWKEGDKYVSQCLDVDISSFGNTRKEAISNLEEALSLYYSNENVPQKSQVKYPKITQVEVKYA